MHHVPVINWSLISGAKSPLHQPLLKNLDQHVQECNQLGVKDLWQREIFRNDENKLPQKKSYAYYWEFRLSSSEPYRIVLGNNGEVYVTWDHYGNFLQVNGVPGVFPISRPFAATYYQRGTNMESKQKYKIALSYFQASLEYYRPENDKQDILKVLLAVGKIAQKIKTKAGPYSNSDQDAARLYAAVDTLGRRLGLAKLPKEAKLTEKELQFKNTYPQAWAEGQKWELVKAIEYTLSQGFGKCHP